MNRRMRMVLGPAAVIGAACAFAGEAEDAKAPATRAATTQAAGTLRGFRLSPSVYPDGVTDERGYRATLAAQAAKLEHDAGVAGATATRAQLRLALANHVLGPQADEPATALLLGSATAEQLNQLRAQAEKALAHVGAGLALLDDAEEDASQKQAEALDELRGQAEMLEGLAHMIAAAVSAEKEAVKRAAIRLAAAQESGSPAVAAAAQLWHAAALVRTGDVKAALDVIDLVLRKPKVQPYEFFARLVRCDALARKGSDLLAVALTMRLEERCADWFSDKERASEARRAAATMGARLGEARAARLRADGKTEVAKRAAALAKKLHDAAREKGNTLYRLGWAVPALVTAPEGGPVSLLTHTAYARSVVLVLDRSAAWSEEFDALRAAALRCIEGMTPEQEFQLFLLAAEGHEQIGEGNLVPASDVHKQRARDLLEAASPVAETRAETALEKALSLEPDRIFFFAGTACDAAVAKRVKAWNADGRTAIDVLGLEGVGEKAALDRLAKENRGAVILLGRPLPNPAAPDQQREDNR